MPSSVVAVAASGIAVARVLRMLALAASPSAPMTAVMSTEAAATLIVTTDSSTPAAVAKAVRRLAFSLSP